MTTFITKRLVDEELILKKYGFVPVNYNGISVFYNSQLSKHYFKERNRKSKIVLHHTAGGFEGDLITLTSTHKSTAFLISPQGRIVMLFHPWNWSWHLGKEALGGNTNQSKLSIGIEISNWGYLVPKENTLYTYSGIPYCDLDETDLYIKSDEWKVINGVTGERSQYFAKYTEPQYHSLKILKNKLCELYKIPNQRWLNGYNPQVAFFNGITTHTDFRKDKYDLSPIFDYSKIEL